MPQTVQVLRTLTNNAPPALLPGAMSAEFGGNTKLWVGSHTGNRLLISDNPADLPAAGANYLPLVGGTLTGTLRAQGPGGWSQFNIGRQLFIASNTSNPALGIGDVSGNNPVAIVNAGGSFDFAGMPALTDNTTPSNSFLNLGPSGAAFHVSVTLAGAPTAAMHAATKSYVDDLVGAVEAVTKLAGSYNAAADLIRPVQGVSVAGPLPAADPLNQGWYLIIETAGIGIGNAPPVEMSVGDWIISTGTAWVHLDLNLETVEAANVAVVPIPGLVATNVQAALEELPTKAYAAANYLPLSGGTITGSLAINGETAVTNGIRYNGSNVIGFSWTGGFVTASVDNSGTPGALAHTNWVSSTFLPLSGGTLLGALTLPSDPVQPLEAATKAYVDAHPGAGGNWLPLSGGTLTGTLSITRPIPAALNQPTVLSPFFTLGPLGSLDFNRYPTNPTNNGGNYLSDGFAGSVLVDATGGLTFMCHPSGVADAVANTTAGYMQLRQDGSLFVRNGTVLVERDATGPLEVVPLQQLNTRLSAYLPLTGGALSGDLSTSGNLVAGSQVHAPAGFVVPGGLILSMVAGRPTISWLNDQWFDYMEPGTGTRVWWSPVLNAAAMVLDGSGNLIVPGTINGVPLAGFETLPERLAALEQRLTAGGL